MDTARIVLDVGVVLLLAAGAGLIARRIGLPAVVGYLLVGLAVSPFTPGYVADRAQIELLADIGVVLLLFEVGIEVDLGDLWREQRALLTVAPIQVALTTAVATAAFLATGVSTLGATLFGLSIAMSSSVVVVNVTRSRRSRMTPDTRQALLGWSVVQDVTGIGLTAVALAVLSGGDRPVIVALAGLVAYAAIAVLSAAGLPRVLRLVMDQQDLFLMVCVGAGLALAALGAVAFGVPMALAAFIAGLALAEEKETAAARQRLQPLRDVFAVLFFVAIGSLIDPARLPAALPFLGLVLLLVAAAKVVPIAVLARLAGLPASAPQLGVGLGQVGEFSYVLGTLALGAGAVGEEQFAGLLAAVVITIAASAVAARYVGIPSRAPARVG